MSYGDGEGAALTLLREMAQFDAANTSRANWRILNSGASDQYAVLRDGGHGNDYDVMGRGGVTSTYRTVVQLWQRYREDGPSALELQELTAAVVEHLEQYPDLGGTATTAAPESVGEMQERWNASGGPEWLTQEVVIVWQEERLIP